MAGSAQLSLASPTTHCWGPQIIAEPGGLHRCLMVRQSIVLGASAALAAGLILGR